MSEERFQEQLREQVDYTALIKEMRKFTIVVAKLEALVPRIEATVAENSKFCREDMRAHEDRITSLETLAACKKGQETRANKAWYRNPGWWHSAAVWAAIALSFYFGRGTPH